MYPKLCNWILFRKEADGSYTLWDCYNTERYTVSSKLAYFARRLDGKTDPFSIVSDPVEVLRFLNFLTQNDCLRYGRVMRSEDSLLCSLLTLKKHRTDSIIPIIFNYLLLFLLLPVLVLGITVFLQNLHRLDTNGLLLGHLLGILFGSVLHEVAHAMAAFCYGGRVFEAGVMLSHYFLPGAYVIVDSDPVRNRLHRAQIFAAGVEMDLLLTGLGLLLAGYIAGWSGLFFGFALSNCLIALWNTLLYNGLDGMTVMSTLLGMDCSLIDLAKYTLSHKKERMRLLKAGPHGVVELIICGFLVALQIIYPLVFLLALMELIECFS